MHLHFVRMLDVQSKKALSDAQLSSPILATSNRLTSKLLLSLAVCLSCVSRSLKSPAEEEESYHKLSDKHLFVTVKKEREEESYLSTTHVDSECMIEPSNLRRTCSAPDSNLSKENP